MIATRTSTRSHHISTNQIPTYVNIESAGDTTSQLSGVVTEATAQTFSENETATTDKESTELTEVTGKAGDPQHAVGQTPLSASAEKETAGNESDKSSLGEVKSNRLSASGLKDQLGASQHSGMPVYVNIASKDIDTDLRSESPDMSDDSTGEGNLAQHCRKGTGEMELSVSPECHDSITKGQTLTDGVLTLTDGVLITNCVDIDIDNKEGNSHSVE